MCQVISRESMSRGIKRVASGHSKATINSNEATCKFITPFGVQTVTISRDKVAKAGRAVLQSRL